MKKAPRQRGTIEKHGSPWKMDTIVVIASPTRGFVLPPPDMPPVTSPYPARPKIRMKKAQSDDEVANVVGRVVLKIAVPP